MKEEVKVGKAERRNGNDEPNVSTENKKPCELTFTTFFTGFKGSAYRMTFDPRINNRIGLICIRNGQSLDRNRTWLARRWGRVWFSCT